MDSSADVAVVGAGLIGLATAFELAQAGAHVRVYDRAEPARAASWAGAGMLAPYTENIEDDVLREQCIESLAMYPAFVERVHTASGVDPRLRLDGIVTAFFNEANAQELKARAEALRAQGIACEFWDRVETLRSEPFLGKHVHGALVVSQEGYVDNRRLGRALVAACESVGVTIASGVRDLAVECDERRVLGVRTDRGFAPASHVIVAAGSLSTLVPGIPEHSLPKVTPVKGQMLALGVPDGFVKRTTWVPGAYLVPRDDGRLLVGATVEHVGFDQRVTAQGMRQLLDAALNAAPALSDFSVTETWAGLRPASEDGRPIVGATDIEGLIYATGHYRNGILLTPWTARAVTAIVAKQTVP